MRPPVSKWYSKSLCCSYNYIRPHSPGGCNNVNDNKSAATTNPILNFFSLEIKSPLSNTAPFLFGYCKIEPKKLSSISTSFVDDITRSIPKGSDLVSSAEIV